MLSRPATTINLATEDIIAYEQRKMARDAIKARAEHEQHLLNSSQGTSNSTVEDDSNLDATPAQQTRAAKAKAARDQRIGVGSARER